MTSSRIDACRLRDVLDYDQVTGLFTWKVRTSNRVTVGRVAGTSGKHGYVQIHIEAANAVAEARRRLHGEFANHG